MKQGEITPSFTPITPCFTPYLITYLKEYLLMCEKAVEIQEPWRKKLSENPSYADIYCQYVSGELIGPMFKSNKLPVPKEKIQLFKHFWLPRQDQLQEMVRDKEKNKYPFDLLDNFQEFTKDLEHGYSGYYSTMEQLWLAFVMKEKYNKVWTDTDWQPAGEG